jgi:hypothetical protein
MEKQKFVLVYKEPGKPLSFVTRANKSELTTNIEDARHYLKREAAQRTADRRTARGWEGKFEIRALPAQDPDPAQAKARKTAQAKVEKKAAPANTKTAHAANA